jgi:3-hydroxymyristoyl/3-hydroxydecanoyl-(acyl carrier protein) dehydratase
MLPLADFDDPARVRNQFESLYRPQLKDAPRVSVKEMTPFKAIAGARTFESLRFVDGLVEHEPYKRVVGFKNFSACEPYFATHFPRKPCVPGVLLTTFMGEVCQYLVKESVEAPLRDKVLVPTFIQNVRFRKFVEPGDQCVLDAKIVAGDARLDGQDLLVRAVINANGTRVMQAEMGFRTMFAKAHPFGRNTAAQAG